MIAMLLISACYLNRKFW